MPSLEIYLKQLDERWDPVERAVWAVVKSPGYHTRIPDGVRAHWTRESMDYAIANLQTDQAWRHERAAKILERIVGLQVTDPLDSHFGIWGWFVEEPPAFMAPADWNWADFIGARLAQVLVCHASLLGADLRNTVRESLRKASWSIFRRNCGLGYTNIAVMGGVVTASAGEILNDATMLDYGRRRLQGVVDLVGRVGGFTEYNSPTYTRVALEEVERAMLIVRDPQARAAAEALRWIAWETLSEHYHPATGQIAGPQSRAYADWVSPELSAYFHEQTGATVPLRNTSADSFSIASHYCIVPGMPCPTDLADRFERLPRSPMVVRHRFSENTYGDTIGTTWFDRDACLGSVTRGFGWVQQRPVLGYWKTEQDPGVCLRVRVMKNGKDFSSSYLWATQHDNILLGSASIVQNSGDHHITLDKPAGGLFEMTDLRIRVTLMGRGVSVSELTDERFELRAGGWKAVVHAPPVVFEGRSISWTVNSSADEVDVDAVLYRGPSRTLDSNTTGVRAVYGLELIRSDQATSGEKIEGTEVESGVQWKWRGLEVLGRTRPVPFAW